jgi:DNA-binding NarL/FixJ family response regulator
MMIRVLLAEDHPVLRAALRALLDAELDLEVVGEARDSSATLDLAGQVRPEVIVLDIGLPGLQSFDTVRMLTQALPDTQLLILMDYEDAGLARDLLVAGAAGCVICQVADSTLAAAVRAVSQGQLYINPYVMRALLADLLLQAAFRQQATADLTPGEADVLRLVAQGYTNRQISEELGLSVRAVESHREKIMVKLGLHGRAQFVRYAAIQKLAAEPCQRRHAHSSLLHQ